MSAPPEHPYAELAGALVDLCGSAQFFALQLQSEMSRRSDREPVTHLELLTLIYALRHAETTSQEAATALGVTARVVQSAVRALERRQLLEVRDDRDPILAPTRAGRDLAVSIIRRAHQRMRYVLAGLSPANAELLRSAAPCPRRRQRRSRDPWHAADGGLTATIAGTTSENRASIG